MLFNDWLEPVSAETEERLYLEKKKTNAMMWENGRRRKHGSTAAAAHHHTEDEDEEGDGDGDDDGGKENIRGVERLKIALKFMKYGDADLDRAHCHMQNLLFKRSVYICGRCVFTQRATLSVFFFVFFFDFFLIFVSFRPSVARCPRWFCGNGSVPTGRGVRHERRRGGRRAGAADGLSPTTRRHLW
jgi:hypothetical protein